jgi:ankyrin repeat protein
MNFIDFITYFIAIRMALIKGHIEVFKLLLNHPNADPSADNNYGMNFIDFITY